MTDIKYDFFDRSFDVSTANKKTQGTDINKKYVELVYPGDNKKPTLSYDGMQFYPVRLVISGSSGSTDFDYVMVLETVSKVNEISGPKLFIQLKIKNDNANANGSLTTLFSAIGTDTATLRPAIVNLNSLLGDPTVYPAKHAIYKNTSADLTLYINPVISLKLDDSAKRVLTGGASLATIFSTITAEDSTFKVKEIILVASPLMQRQRCTRSSDNSSTVVSVVKPTTSSVQTNILVLVIIGLCVAAFFPTIYYGLVCFPAGTKPREAIHLIYLIGALSMVMPLFVRGFKDGDPAAQVWGVGIIVLVLIFGWQYYDLSSKMILKCGVDDTVINVNISGHFGNISKNYLFFILFVLCLLPLFISAMVKSADDSLFGGLVGGQAIIMVIAVCLFGIYGK
jgi:hypothetical protein